MVDTVASVSLGGWLILLMMVMAVPLVVCLGLLLVAFMPTGAGAAGWHDREILPHRAGTASWRELHPAWPPPCAPGSVRLLASVVAVRPPRHVHRSASSPVKSLASKVPSSA